MLKSHVRKDIETLSQSERDTVIRAFDYIGKLSPEDPNSFFALASYHGLPGPEGNSQKMYCPHGNVLFPTWHRAYLLRVEKALQSAPGCGHLALPYWNQTSESSLKGGLPSIFTNKSYTFASGDTINNPLYSYTMQKAVDGLKYSSTATHSKPVGHTTVRYPFSGRVASEEVAEVKSRNSSLEALPHKTITGALDENIRKWLAPGYLPGVAENYRQSLEAPSYTVFSNIASAQEWNTNNAENPQVPNVVPLELPHNSMHLAIGGFQVPGAPSVHAASQGDMGENETAAFDPIFYFHHCFIDYMFWMWQDQHGQKDHLDITPGMQGTKGADIDTPLEPFTMTDPNTGTERWMTSKDVIDTVKLGYDYAKPQWQKFNVTVREADAVNAPKLTVSGINRSKIRGSFIVSTWVKGQNGEPEKVIDIKPILSRWEVDSCENCQNYLDVRSHTQLTKFTEEEIEDMDFFALVHTREHPDGIDTIDGRPIEVELGALRGWM
ncbi:Tyrosinase [Colletotrichum gloeosporioides]|uniref:tyrosinase n=1 Tax=Colletotrichum gloeosporioides TaxID=474922 RepID=A0A8H4C956_COLGL|nr:Tyrosinase [Colletotrichum gloeosporioides]KAF3799704.1 Tyrosinase [Colletotrichum gloeosporioides]